MGKLTLNPEQDGAGYFYGQHHADDGTAVRVDVLPPKSYPRPSFVISSEGMHDTDWIVYANGKEIARVKRREELDTLDIANLLPSH